MVHRWLLALAGQLRAPLAVGSLVDWLVMAARVTQAALIGVVLGRIFRGDALARADIADVARRGTFQTASKEMIIGQLLGTQDYAARSIASLKQTVATVQQKAQNLPKESVAVTAGLFSGSFFIYGPPSIANTQLETLGLINAFSDLNKRDVEVSPEELVARNPGFLVLGYDPVSSSPEKMMQQAMSVPGFATMIAVQNHRILVLSDTYLLGRAVDGLPLMYDAIAAAK